MFTIPHVAEVGQSAAMRSRVELSLCLACCLASAGAKVVIPKPLEVQARAKPPKSAVRVGGDRGDAVVSVGSLQGNALEAAGFLAGGALVFAGADSERKPGSWRAAAGVWVGRCTRGAAAGPAAAAAD